MHVHTLVQDDESAHSLAVLLGRNACHLHVLHAGQLVEELFNFSRINVFASTDNHVLDTSGNAVISIFILYAQVARVQESVFVYHFCRSFGILVVAFHGVIAAVAHFALYAHRTFFASLRVNDTYFRMLKIMSYGVATHVK